MTMSYHTHTHTHTQFVGHKGENNSIFISTQLNSFAFKISKNPLSVVLDKTSS